MSTDIKEVVKEKYGQAALRVHSGGSSCCGASTALDGCCDPITTNLYDASSGKPDSRRRAEGLAGMRQSNGAGPVEPRRNRTRPRFRRRH